jgi:hypothetical protein
MPPRTPSRVLMPKPPNPAREAYPQRLLYDLNPCHHLSSTARSPSPSHPRLTWSTSTRSTPSPHVHLFFDGPKCQPHTVSLSALSPSVQVSRPSFTAPSPSARTRLTFYITIDRLSAPHLCTTNQETYCTTPRSRHG